MDHYSGETRTSFSSELQTFSVKPGEYPEEVLFTLCSGRKLTIHLIQEMVVKVIMYCSHVKTEAALIQIFILKMLNLTSNMFKMSLKNMINFTQIY